MATRPLVSVIMNCLNGAQYLVEAIDSVFTQEFEDWEIVFFDNVSSDASAGIAKSYGSRVKYFRASSRLALGAARDAAFARAKGKYLAFLDCDDLWLPEKLGRQIAAFEGRPSRRIGLCYTDAMRIGAAGHDLVPYSRERRLFEGDAFVPLIRDCFIGMSSCMVDRQAAVDCGGFNEAYQYVEDWDLWLKIARHYDVALVPDKLTKIRIHATNETRNLAAHDEEKLTLFNGLQVASRDEERVRRGKVREETIRSNINQLIASQQTNTGATVTRAMRTAYYCLASPIISWQLMSKYLNPDMIRIYRSKFTA